MKVDDRVVLKEMKEDENDSFWTSKAIDYNSIGTVHAVMGGIDEAFYIEIKWDNGSVSLCKEKYLKLYKSENIPLPNLKFKRQKVR